MKFIPASASEWPDLLHADYRSTALRGSREAPIPVASRSATERGIVFPAPVATPRESDLLAWGSAAPLGERILLTGRVCDEDGRPAAHSLVEIWQCNAAGRYAHRNDTHDAPLDPNFPGFGRTLTDAEGRYRFVTIKPGAYPWGNHSNAWRPAHVHFSLFGSVYAQRLITQMYFPGDPLLPLDPIFNSVPDEHARQRLVSRFDIEQSVAGWALAYVFDIVLRGRAATPTGL